MKKLSFIIIALLLVNTVAYGKGVDHFIAILKSNVKTEKKAMLAQSMQLTYADAPDFLGVYSEYELELSKIIDDRVELLRDFAQNYNNLTDAKARELAKKVFALEKRRTKLKKKYFRKFYRTLSATIAAKFIQVENQINLLLDLQIASELPLIKLKTQN